MLVVKIFGGLGNQMFQYAFYLYLKKNNKNVYLDTSDFKVHKHHNGFELEKVFALDYESVDRKKVRLFAVDSNLLIVRSLKKIFGVELRKFEECSGHHHFVLIDSTHILENVYFDGYWQNVKYLETVEEELKRAFSFKKTLSGKNKELQKIISERECVAVHIRRGDYVNNPKLALVCGIEYYCNAINYMNNINNKLQYIVFSDDPDWVKNNLKFPNGTIYVDWNKGTESYIDMQLMKLCQHSIIANSTFSWWPAWLKADENHKIIMPQNWFVDEESNRLNIKGSIKL